MPEKSTNVDYFDDKVSRSVDRFSAGWTGLTHEERDLAKEITVAVERVGGRNRAAEIMGVGVSSIDNYRSGKRQPKALELRRLTLASAALASVQTLIERGPVAEDAEQRVSSLRDSFDNSFDAVARTISIPRYDVQVSAGGGALVLSDEVTDRFVVSRDWLSQYVPKGADSGIVVARGDSMEPTIQDGDVLLLNFSIDRTAIDAGGVFVLTVDGALLVKRLQVMLDGHILVISDNDQYQPEKISREFADEQMVVHAQVVWVGGPIRKR